MAWFAPLADGDWGTAGTWGTVTALGTSTDTATGYLTTSNRGYSDVFTAPSTGDSAVGIVVMQGVHQVALDEVTIELQEYDGATWNVVSSNAISEDDLFYLSWPLRLDLTTPYQYTTTSVGYYRWCIYDPSASNHFKAFKRGGGGTYDFYCHMIDDRAAAASPVSGDQVFACASVDQPITVTVDAGTHVCGNFGADKTVMATTPSAFYDCGIVQNWPCTLDFDTTGTIDFTVEGFWAVATGQITHGSDGSPGTNDVTIKLDTNGVNGQYGVQNLYYSSWRIYADATITKGDFWSAGDGATGTELTVPSDWIVGDRIVVASATSYADLEVKFIKTKPTSTTATLSDTDGGAESALANTYDTDAYMARLNRGFKIQSEDPDNYRASFNARYGRLDTKPTQVALYGYIIEGVEWKNCPLDSDQATVNWKHLLTGCTWPDYVDLPPIDFRGSYTGIFTDCVQMQKIGHAVNIGGLPIDNTYVGTVFDGHVMINHRYYGVYLRGFNCTFRDMIMRCGEWGNSAAGAAFLVSSGAGNTIQNLDSSGRGETILYYTGTSVANRFIDCKYRSEDTAVQANSGVFVQDYHGNCLLDSPTELSGADDMAAGSSIVFDTYDQTTNDHRTFSPTGDCVSTGAGLADTITRTAGNLSRKITQSGSDSVLDDFLVVAAANSASTVTFYARRTSALTSATFNFYLPGSTTPDDTVAWSGGTLPAADTWTLVNLGADYTSSTPRYSKVEIVADNSGGSLYYADVYNGENDISGLNAYFEGAVGPVITPDVTDLGAIAQGVWGDTETYSSGTKGDDLANATAPTAAAVADAVWDEATSGHTTSGTYGLLVSKLLTVAKFLGLK